MEGCDRKRNIVLTFSCFNEISLTHLLTRVWLISPFCAGNVKVILERGKYTVCHYVLCLSNCDKNTCDQYGLSITLAPSRRTFSPSHQRQQANITLCQITVSQILDFEERTCSTWEGIAIMARLYEILSRNMQNHYFWLLCI